MMIGKRISHYSISGEIGVGGMGIVYKAEDTILNRTVALKFLPSEFTRNESAKKRFITEARAASRLDHPNICTIHDIIDTDDDNLCIVMAYYEGMTLEDILKKGPLKFEETVNIFKQIAEGLKEAHEKGIVHRDIKAANILLTNEGVAKILDFGIAKLSDKSHITKTEVTAGTISYMSPEQIKRINVDKRSDIWSLGVLLFQAVTGEFPFRGEYEQAVIYSILLEEYSEPSDPDNFNYIKLKSIIERCLQKNPDERYQDVVEFEKSISELIEQPAESYAFLLRKRGLSTRIISIFIVVFGAIILILFWSNIKRWAVIYPIPDKKHIAIIPFMNIGGDSTSQAFCDGLMEMVSSSLTSNRITHNDLWVVPCSEVRRFDITSAGEAYHEFGVNLAVTGSFQKADNDIIMTLNLVDTKSMRQLDSRVIDDRISNLSFLQNEVIGSLASMLGINIENKTSKSIVSPDAYAYYLQGKGYLMRYEKLSSIEAAISLFHQSLNEDSKFVPAYAGLAEGFLRKYKITNNSDFLETGILYCDTALQMDSDLPLVYFILGMIKQEKGEYQEAIKSYKKSIKGDPVNSELYSNLAVSYELLKDYKNAEHYFFKSIETEPNHWGGFNKLGAYYLRQGRFDDALTQFNQVVKLTPDNIRGYNNIGAVYFYMQDYDKAVEAHLKSVSIQPNEMAYSNLGTIFYYQRKYSEAVKYYENAIKLSADNYIIWGNLAACYDQLEEKRDKKFLAYRNAATLAEEMLKINSSNMEVAADLASYYSALGDKNRAKSIIDKVADSNPEDVTLVFRLVDVYEQLGERELALKYISAALNKGYSLAEIEENPALENLKKDKRFQEIISRFN